MRAKRFLPACLSISVPRINNTEITIANYSLQIWFSLTLLRNDVFGLILTAPKCGIFFLLLKVIIQDLHNAWPHIVLYCIVS